MSSPGPLSTPPSTPARPVRGTRGTTRSPRVTPGNAPSTPVRRTRSSTKAERDAARSAAERPRPNTPPTTPRPPVRITYARKRTMQPDPTLRTNTIERAPSVASIASILTDSTLPSLSELYPISEGKPLSVRITDAFLENAACPVCLRIALDVVSVQCGHSFCSKCLHTGFVEELKRKVLDCLGRVFLHPDSVDGHKRITSALKSAGYDPIDVFSYECPLCRAHISKPPVINYSARALVSALYETLLPVLISKGFSGVRDVADSVVTFHNLFIR